ncbi:hypothetical protein BH11PSE8_BH11PSE8_46860 [soil metagenome]
MFDDGRPFTDADKVRPFVYEDARSVAMHFDISATQSRMRRDDPDRLDLDYTRAMAGFVLLRPEPRAILVIGLGGGSLPKYCHKHLASAHITVVEINPHVIAMRETFCIPADGARFRVVCDDGAGFVRDTEDRYDVILVDGFTYDGQPEQLCSLAFYDACRTALAADGVLVVNLHDELPMSDMLCDRITTAFGPGLLAIEADGGSNRVVLACTAAMLDDCRDEFEARWRALAPVHQQMLRVNGPRVARALGGRTATTRAPMEAAPIQAPIAQGGG